MSSHTTPGGRVAVRRRTLAVLATAAGALALAGPAAALADASAYYVGGPNCSDGRAPEQNTIATPWCTVGKGISAAPAGSTVLVRGGNYPFVPVAGVSHDDYVDVAPYPGETPVIDGLDASGIDHVRMERLSFTGGVVVRAGHDLQFSANTFRLKAAGPRTDSGFVLNKVANVLVEANHVIGGRDGVNINGSVPASHDVVVWRNHFDQMGNDAVHIATGESRILVAGNLIDNCYPRADIDKDAHSDAIQSMGPTQDVTAYGNTVLGGRGFLFMVDPKSQGRKGYGQKNLLVENNVFTGRDFAVRAFSAPGIRIINNTAWGPTNTGGIELSDRTGKTNDKTGGVVLTNNVIKTLKVNPRVAFAVRANNVIKNGPRTGADLAGMPQFADQGDDDLALLPGSIGIDDADAAFAPDVDILGRDRGGRPDVGAIETTSGPAATGLAAPGVPDAIATAIKAQGGSLEAAAPGAAAARR